MKRISALLLLAAIAMGVEAKDIKRLVVTPTPKMTCEKCEQKIKSNIRFVKGTKTIETRLADQLVVITYDADECGLDDYVKAFAKIGRTIKVVEQPAGEKVATDAGKLQKGAEPVKTRQGGLIKK